MTNMAVGAEGRAGCVFSLFWSFHRLAGDPVKRVYKGGLATIALLALAAMAWSAALALQEPGSGAVRFFTIAALVGGGIVGWRFACAVAEGLALRRA